jgi:MSHA biogenesis protein MshO
MARATPGQVGIRPQAKRSGGGAGPRGFSLIELIVVIVITGVIASAVGLFIAGPIQGFFDQARRGELVDAAQLALVRMGRDLRAALPNSIRVNGNALELLLTLDGERYRAEPPGAADDRLEFTATDSRFNTFAPLYPGTPLVTPYTVAGYLAIYPLQQAGANPYVAADGVMTGAGTFIVDDVENPAGSGLSEYRVTLPVAHRFPFDSPTRRVFLVEGPVTYFCDLADPASATYRSLLRYSGYAVATAQPAPPSMPLAATAEVVTRNLQACGFGFDPGTAQRNAVVSVSVALAHPASPAERVRLIRQVHLDNTP